LNDTEKIKAILKEINSLNIIDLQSSLNLIIQAYGDAVQSIYDSKIKLEEGEVFIETLIIKMIFASKSVLHISNGTEFCTIKNPNKMELIDSPSVYILTRSIIETFLTLEYLYFNALSREEQLFRYNLWRISGFKSRQNYFNERTNLDKKVIEKLNNEKELIEELKIKIKESLFYKDLNNQSLWKLDNFGLPRLTSWSNLINNSKLKNSIFSTMYKLYSNYAHSEYISMIQINEGSLGKNNDFNKQNIITSLSIIRMINCVTLIMLQDKFNCVLKEYDSMNDNLKFSIDFWNSFATE